MKVADGVAEMEEEEDAMENAEVNGGEKEAAEGTEEAVWSWRRN